MYIYICNTFSDSISEINIREFKEERRIKINSNQRVGPHGIHKFSDILFTANNYSNDISLIDLNDYSVRSFYVGTNCTDIKVNGDKAYIVCGDSNDMKVFNLLDEKIEKSIYCGDFPHSIDIQGVINKILVCSMRDGYVNLLDLNEEKVIDKVKVGNYPTKAIFCDNGRFILVCESHFGEKFGNITVLDKELKHIEKLKVGKGPVDMYSSGDKLYISNMGDGTVSVIDLELLKEVDKISIGGMPRGIIEKDGFLYVGDYFRSRLIKICLKSRVKECIYIGKEPNSMILV
ncbi:YncE family protein [Hathewaya histolytica]|uniref:Surface antigen n=1 Tax=Hathewaya histolytica TaxID=1498 RepID=A0A4U9RLT2_HATHI|nr:YncE family protein [Hathewaya histolytica]VTQ93114.1 surface antigen [Hathewaya histolytica]